MEGDELSKLDMHSVDATSQGERIYEKGMGPITVARTSSEIDHGNPMKSDVGTPMRRRNLKSPMILQERQKFRTPHARSGSVDQGSPSNDPVHLLLRKLKHDKRIREKAIRER